MFGQTWRIGRIAGVDIRIDVSWAVIVLLIGYSFFAVLVNRFGTERSAQMFVVAAVMSVAFFASVLAHELAHAIVSKGRGIEVEGITLFLFGGATQARLDTRKPVDELVVAAVGPLTSLLLGAVAWVLVRFLGLTGAPGFAVGYLGWLNVALGAFNLFPGFPLDGGRVLRSIVWSATGDQVRATRIAAGAGQVLGYGLIGIGLLFVFQGQLGGLWYAAIGWFLTQAARSSFSQVRVRDLLKGVSAAQVMEENLVRIDASLSVRGAVDEYFLRYDYNAFPVEGASGTVGMLTLPAVRRIPQEQWDFTSAADAMTTLDEGCTVSRDASMGLVLDRLESPEVGRVLVVDQGEVVGIITPRNVARWLRRIEELGISHS